VLGTAGFARLEEADSTALVDHRADQILGHHAWDEGEVSLDTQNEPQSGAVESYQGAGK
jgi:hypothetical protein